MKRTTLSTDITIRKHCFSRSRTTLENSVRALGATAIFSLALSGCSAQKAAPGISRRMDPVLLKITERDQERDYVTDEQILAQDRSEARTGWKFEKLFHGDPTRKWIALTIDDGPHAKTTPQLLQVLARLKVPATFFVIGEEAQLNPDLIRAEVAGGHEVSNHTYHHVRLNYVRTELIAPEISACDAVLQAITGRQADRYLRPPGGGYDSDVIAACRKLGKTIVLYTDDPTDYASPPPDVLYQRIMKRASPGGILLLHDGVQETIDLLPKVVKALKAKGYRFVTVSHLDAAARTNATRTAQRSAPLPKVRSVAFGKQ